MRDQQHQFPDSRDGQVPTTHNSSGTVSQRPTRPTSRHVPSPAASLVERIVVIGWERQTVTLLIRCDHPAVTRKIHGILDLYFGRSPAEPRGSDPKLTLDLSAGQGDGSLPPTASGIADFNGVEIRSHEKHYYISLGRSVVELDSHAGSGVGVMDPAEWSGSNSPTDRQLTFLLLCLLSLLHFRQWYAMHAAALTRDGHGCLLAGDSGSGKSTLALVMMRLGWKLVSDDSVILRASGPRISAWTLRSGARLLFSSARLFPQLLPYWHTSPRDGSKRWFDLEAITPGSTQPGCIPKLLFFPLIAPEPESRLEALQDVESLFRVIGQNHLLTLEASSARQHLEVLRRLVQQSSSYVIHAGQDILDRPSSLAALLSPALRRSGFA